MLIGPKMKLLTVVAAWLTLFGQGQAAFAQTQGTTISDTRAANVAQLLKELRWHDNPSHENYLQIREERTTRLLTEIDRFVAEAFAPRTATSITVQNGLDALLGHKRGDGAGSVVFSTNLPVGHFLVVGLEITRGGGALPEDAFSFRAYKDTGDTFVFVAATRYGHGGAVVNAERPLEELNALFGLHAKPVPSRPVGNEFWFIAWAASSLQMPHFVSMRLYAFDGADFRILWAPTDFIANDDRAFELTVDGFTIRKLSDPTHMARGSPTVVIREQYALTVDGPQKVNEWENSLDVEPR